MGHKRVDSHGLAQWNFHEGESVLIEVKTQELIDLCSEGKTRPKSSAPALRSSEVVDGKPSKQVIGVDS